MEVLSESPLFQFLLGKLKEKEPPAVLLHLNSPAETAAWIFFAYEEGPDFLGARVGELDHEYRR